MRCVSAARDAVTYPASRGAKWTVLIVFSGTGLFIAGWSLVEGAMNGTWEAIPLVAFGGLLALWGIDLAGYRVEVDSVRVMRRTTFRNSEVLVQGVRRATLEHPGARTAPQVHLYDGEKTLKITAALWEPDEGQRFLNHARELFASVWVVEADLPDTGDG